MNKKLVFGVVAGLIVLAVLVFIFLPRHSIPNNSKCGTALSDNNITILYDGKPIDGQYYWFNTADNWADVQKVSNSQIDLQIPEEQSQSYTDLSIKIVKLDRNEDLIHDDEFNINWELNNDPNYERGKVIITQDRILRAVRSYSIGEPEYFEVSNVLNKTASVHHNIVIDLKTGKIVSSSEVSDNNLWMPCDY